MLMEFQGILYFSCSKTYLQRGSLTLELSNK